MQLTQDEKTTIADALNVSADKLESMAENRDHHPASTREVWFQGAENKRLLALKIIGWPECEDAAERGRRAGAAGMSPAVCMYARGEAKRAIWRNAYLEARGEQNVRTVAK